jgi:hypothetical protein
MITGWQSEALRLLFQCAALLPLAVLTAQVFKRGRIPPLVYTGVALALALSWFADDVLRDGAVNRWLVVSIHAPVQAAVIVWAVTRMETDRALSYAAGAGLAVVLFIGAWPQDAAGGPNALPLVVAHVSAAVVTLLVTWDHRELGLLRLGLVVYFGIGAAWMLAWPWTWGSSAFTVAFFGYQATRLLGLWLAARAMWRFRNHLPHLTVV